MLLQVFASLLKSVLDGFRAEITPALRALEVADPRTIELSSPILAEIVRKYRVQAAKIANDFMADEAAKAGGVAKPPPVEGYPSRAVFEVLKTSKSIEEITGSLERHVLTAARRQVARSVPAPVVPDPSELTPTLDEVAESQGKLLADTSESEADPDKPTIYPVGWARVLTGNENCPFCIMLASRGPVYSSAHHAGKRSAQAWSGQARAWANSYHDHCDCMVVPVYDAKKWAGKKQADALYKVYERVTRGDTAGGKKISEGNDKLKSWSKYLRDLEKDGKTLKYPALDELDQ